MFSPFCSFFSVQNPVLCDMSRAHSAVRYPRRYIPGIKYYGLLLLLSSLDLVRERKIERKEERENREWFEERTTRGLPDLDETNSTYYNRVFFKKKVQRFPFFKQYFFRRFLREWAFLFDIWQPCCHHTTYVLLLTCVCNLGREDGFWRSTNLPSPQITRWIWADRSKTLYLPSYVYIAAVSPPPKNTKNVRKTQNFEKNYLIF